jgi:transcriptional regulator with XRE-family HTH domain
MTLGERLREERERQGLTRPVLAERSGTSVSAILRAEVHGDHPRIPTLASWANALDVSVAFLLTGEPEKAAS